MSKKLLFSLFVLLSLVGVGFSASIDDFEDNDYTNNPTWTASGGTWATTTLGNFNGMYGLNRTDIVSTQRVMTPTIGNSSSFSTYIKIYDAPGAGNVEFCVNALNMACGDDVGRTRFFWGNTGGYVYWSEGSMVQITANTPTKNKWYKMEIVPYINLTGATFNIYDSDGTTLLYTKKTEGSAMFLNYVGLQTYQYGVNFDLVKYGGDAMSYNVTKIYDNSTSHLFKFNTIQSLNFTAYNSTGAYVSQLLTINITNGLNGSSGYVANFTVGDGVNINFNNISHWNYTAFVYNPINLSTNLTTYFYTLNSQIVNTFNNLTNLMSGTITTTRTENITYPYTFNQFLLWNDTYQTLTGNNPYTATISPIDITPDLEKSVNIQSITQATYLGEKINITQNDTQWIFRFDIDNCLTYTTPFLKIQGKDEITNNDLNITLNIYFEFNGVNTYNGTFNSTSSQEFCYNPGSETYYIDGEMEYSGAIEGYTEKRDYFLTNFGINNITNNINLFCLQDNLSDLLEFSVEDDVGTGLPNQYVLFNKWDVGTGSYVGISKTLTNDNGEGNMNINFFDTWYQIIIINEEGEIVKTFTKQKFTSSPVVFPITENIGVEYYYWTNCFSSNIYWTNTSRIVAEVVDSCGLNTALNLSIIKLGVLSNVIECNTELTGSSSYTAYCDLNNTSGNNYYVSINALVDDSIIQLYNEYLDYTIIDDTFKGSGLFASFMIIGTLATLGTLISGSIGAIMGVLGLIMCWILGIISLSWSSIIGIISVIILLLVVLKR